ncbi:MAG: hypothetical protein JNL47_01295 [Bacteroidia bacterium]|nr:hypothetical protein [Bacteroidia bacterium]
MKTTSLVIAVFSMAVAISACKKDKNETLDLAEDARIAYDNSVAEASFDNVSSVADEGYRLKENTSGASASFIAGSVTNCLTITLDTVSNPHVLTLDFGNTDCLCKDGNYRRGKIIVSYTGHYRDSGHQHTISFDNYFINFNKIEGTKTVVNNGHNSSGNLWFSITVSGSVTIDPQYSFNQTGGTINYTSSRTREWIAGESTFAWNDDVYLISGSASGTTTTGNAYSLSIQAGQPLRLEIGFPHFVSGILEITPQGKSTRYIDYSYLNNQRDNLALLTVNGQTRIITLGRRN